MTDPELDARFDYMREMEPPPALQERTLALLRQERAREQRGRWALPAAGGLALAASALLLLRGPTATTAEPGQLVARGSSEISAQIGLKVAVRRAGGVERFQSGARYQPGDTLQFRVFSQDPGQVTLRRNGVVLYQGAVQAGETDLPVGYTLEAGEGASTFLVEVDGVFEQVEVPAP